jgi:hypothetical protein
MAHPAITPAAPGAARPRTPPKRRTEDKYTDGPTGVEDAGGEGGSVIDADAINTANASASASAEDAEDARDTRDKANADATFTLAAAAAVFESVEGGDSDTHLESNPNSKLSPSSRFDSTLISNPRPDSSTIPSYNELHVPNLGSVLRLSPYLDPSSANYSAGSANARSNTYTSFNPNTSSTGPSLTAPERGRSRTRGYHASAFVTALGTGAEGKKGDVGGKMEGRVGERRDMKSDTVEEERDTKLDKKAGGRGASMQREGMKGVEGGEKVKEEEGQKDKQDRTCARAMRRFWVWMWDE